MMKVAKSYNFDAAVVAGVAFDGANVWVSLIGRDSASVARIDRKNGQVLLRVATPKISGLAWDGARLWGASREGILCLDAETLRVVKTLPRPKVEGTVSGLAWDGEALWAGAYHEKKLLKICPETGKVLRELPSDRFVTGITWVAGALWHAVDDEENPARPAEIRLVNGDSGTVLQTHEVPFTVSGLDFDGESFWCGDCSKGILREVSPEAANDQ